jgi:hypothetical protein
MFVLINRIKDDTVKIKAEFILLVSNIEYHYLSFIREAARIVTGLTCYTSLNSIYREAGWEKLSTRQEVKKLCMFYKLNVGNSPEFLCDLIQNISLCIKPLAVQ